MFLPLPRVSRRKTKELTYNYVDRVRLAENSLSDYKCPTRGSGWRQNRSVSHLDLATSCHSAASGLGHWPNKRQLRHSRSLDYNHIDRCKEALDDIAEFYWRIDPEAEFYEDEKRADQKSSSNRHNETHCRAHNYADENYHSAECSFPQQQQQQLQYQSSTVAPLQAFEYDGEACSLRRSRSLAVIREETFSDLQITSASSSRRRSQLIPRARLVNRGFFQERDKLICGNSKHSHHHNHHHHHHHQHNNLQNENLAVNGNVEQDIPSPGSACGSVNGNGSVGGATTCDSHHQRQHQHLQQQQQQQQQQQNNHRPQRIQSSCGVRHNGSRHQSCESASVVDYYENLKRLDALAACFGEQLHPWHNDKSDLESLNSDYFKNSLHQSHELKPHLDIEALEEAVNLLTNDKPRIYQSRRQPPLRSHIVERFCNGKQQKSESTARRAQFNGADSCPENSQSSAFPETTTSNSDDQTDSPSLSEQEYDLTKIEEIFQKTQKEGDDESYELISLTTTRTRLETTEDEYEDENENEEEAFYDISKETKEHDENILNRNAETKIEINTESSLKRTKAISENLEKLIAYDSVYLSSEEGSEETLIEANCTNFEHELEDTSTLLHISIEDTVYEPEITKHQEPQVRNLIEHETAADTDAQSLKDFDSIEKPASPLYTHVLKVDSNQSAGVTSSAASKPKILSVVEKRKLKRFSTSASTSAENSTNHTNADTASQLQSLQHLPQNQNHNHNHSSVLTVSPFAHLKRQATDSVYLPYLPKENLSDNQYHSLPDVNIGQSLKVSECIDAELRSSYNYNRCQCVNVDCQQRGDIEEKTTITQQSNGPITSSSSSSSSKKLKTQDNSVTNEEIYDSIKRFGRAHQKARQREYQELFKSEKNTHEKDKKEFKEHYIPVLEKENITSITTTAATTAVVSAVAAAANTEATSETNTEIARTENSEFQELPKEAPGIEVANFSKEISERAKEIQECGKQEVKQNHSSFEVPLAFPNATYRVSKPKAKDSTAQDTPDVLNHHLNQQFRIIVTDTQNNIIEEDSIDGNRGESTSEEAETTSKSTNDDSKQQEDSIELIQPKSTDNLIKRKSSFSKSQNKFPNGYTNNSLRRVPSKSRRQLQQLRQNFQQGKQIKLSGSETPGKHLLHQTSNENCFKSKEHRVLNTHIYKARPIRVLAANESFRRNTTNGKMSRPQILHVVENKRKVNLASSDAIIQSASQHVESTRAENEYLKKVDAVRCYWSKLVKDELNQEEPTTPDESRTSGVQDEAHKKEETHNREASKIVSNEFPKQPERRHFIVGAHDQRQTKIEAPQLPKACPDEFCSFMPSIEIVELDGEKKATIVSAVSPNDKSKDALLSEASEPQFDHIRYKVLKSQQLLRNNLIPRTKKEAQFDGLIQYLQEYSFQELLSNNNVVIVEPVRTKVELPTMRKSEIQQHNKNSSATQAKISTNNSTGLDHTSRAGTAIPSNNAGIRRHFFYQPVRVNRELYEEELPNPDTVRNVRKFFEEHILPKPGQGLLVRNNGGESETMQLSKKNDSKARRDRKYRYLTIDTSFGHTLRQQQQQQPPHKSNQSGQARKWDTASLSSGISSGDLSSPCECNDADITTHQTNANDTSDAAMSANSALVSAPMAVVHPQEFKRVHVQDVIRQHNNKSIYQTTQPFRIGNVQARPRTTVNGPSGDSSYYRDIYEYHIEQQHSQTTTAAGGNSENSARHNIFPYEDIDDDAELEDDENEQFDTHYVSNEVLQKIRECGSTVTYYGGRVLESTLTDLTPIGSPIQQITPTALTRLRQMETCSVCQPHECPHKSELQHNLRPKDTGIKFKLVKSNSCSSRLELAGADADVPESNKEEETEVVKRMVSRFELKRPNEELVTINNQITIPQRERNQEVNEKQVTVNNHINMPQELPTKTTNVKNNKLSNDAENRSGFLEALSVGNDNIISENTITKIDIQLKERDQSIFESNGTENITWINNCNTRNPNLKGKKIIRNKNVDLAFTMSKQHQQQQVKPTQGTLKDVETVSTAQNIEHNIKSRSTEETLRDLPNNYETSIMTKTKTKTSDDDFKTNSTSQRMSLGKSLPVENATTKHVVKPTQINIPTQIHFIPESSIQSNSDGLCLSTTSSNASLLLEKNVVRHYVANDKSLFEKRKYDDIEFEEFEIYDPIKESEKRAENNMNDTRIETHSNSELPTSASLSDMSTRIDDTSRTNNNDDDTDDLSIRNHSGTSLDSKSKSETDCYDSLDDKL